MNLCPLITPPSGTTTRNVMPSYIASKVYPPINVAGAMTWTFAGGGNAIAAAADAAP